MAKIIVDDKEIEVPDHYTLLQAAEEAGAEVPRFCFHERLSIAGNCRMCLVEVKGGPPKPQASCAMGVKDLRPGPNGEAPQIFTKTPMVKRARENVMEFLLINHPLDCPICDQGGECDLQDQAMAYGRDFSRYNEDKRAVEDKYIGPLVKTVMTRCIHCTRCVRFTTEVAGISELGLIGRGEDAEITTYLEKAMTSELQGNVIDLCPVGALTSRPYAFNARPWELNKTETIDVMDAVGSAIRVDARGREVMRIMPRVNEVINEEWISDKSRFIWDGLKTQRLDRPFIRNKQGRLMAASWNEAFAAIKTAVDKTVAEKIGAIAGDLASVEEIYALKSLLAALGSSSYDCRQDGAYFDPKAGRASYIFNTTIAGIEQSDALLIIGANPRFEASVLNARIRKRQRQRDAYPIAVIGEASDLRYPYEYLGAGEETLQNLIDGKLPFFETLKNAQKPMIIIGQGALIGKNGKSVAKAAAKLAAMIDAVSADWNGYNILHTSASRVGGLDLGFVGDVNKAPANIVSDSDVLFLLGADEIDLNTKKGFTVYIGSHGDHGAQSADVILPGAAYTEKSGIYVNTEGRVQMTNRATFAPGEAKEEWAIIRALSDILGVRLPYDSLGALRRHLYSEYPHFMAVDTIEAGNLKDITALAKSFKTLGSSQFISPIKDFYLTNAIARSSAIMAECSSLASGLIPQAAE